MIDRKMYLSLSALIASDPSIAEFVKGYHTSTRPDDGRTGRIVIVDSDTITGRIPKLVVIDELPDLAGERLIQDLSTLEDRIMAAMRVEADSEPVSSHPKRKAYQTPYGPQRGRKQ